MTGFDAGLSPEERFARVRESLCCLRRECTEPERDEAVQRLIGDLAVLEETGALETVAEVLNVTFGGRV